MTELAEIQAQIATLQKQEQELIYRERRAVVDDIKAQMVAYSITTEELERKVRSGKPAPKTPSPIKYRKSESEYWVGRGPKPQWVKAIEREGETIERYKVPQ